MTYVYTLVYTDFISTAKDMATKIFFLIFFVVLGTQFLKAESDIKRPPAPQIQIKQPPIPSINN